MKSQEQSAKLLEKLKTKKLGKLGMVNTVLTGGIGVQSYMSNRNEGDSVVGAAAKATAETAIASIVGPGMYLAGAAVMHLPGMAVNAYESLSQQARQLEMSGKAVPFQGNTFVDSKQIFTMRQAAVATMMQSKYNLEHAMQGNEASFLHR